MIYTSKPVRIEAFRWFGDNRQEEDPEWFITGIKDGSVTFIRAADQTCVKIKPKGFNDANYAQPGDWIIRSDDGLHQTMQNVVFTTVYELSPDGGV
jgi:hypothetical protein